MHSNKAKKKVEYNHHYLYEYVRANKVCEAVKWLTEHSQLYKEEGIVVDDQWGFSAQDDIDNNNDSDMENKMEIDDNDSNTIEETEKPENMFDNDPSDELSSGSLDTLLQPKDILEDARDVLAVAPAEGNSPVSIFLDKHSKSLSFP